VPAKVSFALLIIAASKGPMLRELVLDTETTGLDPKDNHRIVELACVELINCIPTGASWHWYFNPERDVPKAATEVHGLTSTFLADKPLFGAKADEILAVLDGARLIIHNAAFDVGFLNHEFSRLGQSQISFDRVVDTLALARRKHPGSPNNLDALCRRYGIDNSTRTKHGALLDSELLADVYLRLIGAEQAGLDFVSRPASARIEGETIVQIRPKPLTSRLSPEEQEAHAAFVASLGPNALWRRYIAA
jgi:DNA polymerase III subunit epsilon